MTLAVPIFAEDFTWDGNGNPDNGGNWSDTNNWDLGGYPDDTNDTANLPGPGVDRLIVIDVPTTSDTLHVVADSANNRLRLDADLAINRYDGSGNGAASKVDLNGFTLAVNQGNAIYLPAFDGTGELLKFGTGTATLQSKGNFSGNITVSNGLLYFRSSHWDTAAKLTVLDGGAAQRQAQLSAPNETRLFPPLIEINGHGFGSDGALSGSWMNMLCTATITVASDASITIDEGNVITFKLTGDINGPGELTLEAKSGTIDITGLGITYTNKLIVQNGTTRISGDFPDLKHVLVDAGGVLEGLQSQFSNATVVTQNGGIWLQAANATWTGAGDGSNWTDTANWSPQIVPTNKATIPTTDSPQVIVVDAPAYLDTLDIADDPDTTLRIPSPMEIRFIDGNPNGQGYNIQLDGSTLTVHRANSAYFGDIDGSGHLLTVGPDRVTLNSEVNFTGSIEVSEGSLFLRSGDYSSASKLTVRDGAVTEVHAALSNPDPTIPPIIEINGHGSGANGALLMDCWQPIDYPGTITVATDSRITTKSGGSLEFSGDFNGPGELTLEAKTGTIKVNTLGTAYTNKLIITNGMTEILGDFPALKNILVDGGGVLEGLQTQFPSALVVTQNGGIWNQALNASWTGDGDGTNWSDTANWFPNVIPSNKATIPPQASAVTIVVDVPAYVNTLIMHDDPLVNLRIDEDLEIGFLDDANSQPGITINGATLTLHRADSAYMGKLGGVGTLTKVSDSQVVLNSTDDFSGSITVNDGLFYARGGGSPLQWGAVTVVDGATFRIGGPSPHSEGLANIFINGTGHAAIGAALHITEQNRTHSNLTVLADATVKTDTRMTLNGTLTGPGDMTKIGTADLDLDGVYDFTLIGTNGNRIIANAGTIDISDATLSVNGEEGISPFLKEFIIVDYSAGGTVSGRFVATNDLKVNWGIVYDGTEDNPDAVVLIQLPTSGSVLVFE